MRLYPYFFSGLVLPAVALAAVWAEASGRVHLEVVGDPQQGSALALQEWLQALTRAGIQDVRLRSAQPSDKPAIEVRGTEENPIYMVTAVLGPRDEIFVPGARFRRSDMKRLAEWLEDLAQRGPPDRRQQAGPFGLTAKQFEAVQADLGGRLGFSTQGMTRAEAVDKIKQGLNLPLQIEGQLTDGDDKIEEELSSLARGTALACILRPIGFSLVPQASGGQLAYAVAKRPLDQEIWPIGWTTDKAPNELLPALYESRNVNIENVSAARVIEAVSRHIHLVILLDHNALARHGIDPAKAIVSHPQQRTTYSQALRRVLFRAGLKFEIRVDEVGTAFLWVSTVKPV